METFKIRAVLAAVELKSLSKAAEAYSYTPSAFSHMLSSFEKELGVRIFDRSSKGVSLTEEGKKLYPEFKALVECETRVERVLEKISAGERSILRVGTYSSIFRGFLSKLLHDFSIEHPEIKLYISVMDVLNGWLENDRADIVFADSQAVGDNEWVPLAEDRYSVVAPRGMIESKEYITRDELYDYPHILIETCYLEGYFDEGRFKETVHLNSEDDLSVINMVRQGVGLTVLPNLLLKENMEGVDIISLLPEVRRTIGFAYRKNSKQSGAALSLFIKYLKSKKKTFSEKLI